MTARPKVATRRKIISAAELALLKEEGDLGHLDPITELGCELQQQIPKGEAWLDWIADDGTQAACTAALLSRGFTWEEIRLAFFDMSRNRWLPSVEQLQHTFEMERSSA